MAADDEQEQPLAPDPRWPRLFAVGLGLQEGERRAVLRALPPIAIGHELALVAVVVIVLVLGVVASSAALHLIAAGTLIGFGVFRFARPRAHPRWTRARVNRRELTLWSFLMATAHGAGRVAALNSHQRLRRRKRAAESGGLLVLGAFATRQRECRADPVGSSKQAKQQHFAPGVPATTKGADRLRRLCRARVRARAASRARSRSR